MGIFPFPHTFNNLLLFIAHWFCVYGWALINTLINVAQEIMYNSQGYVLKSDTASASLYFIYLPWRPTMSLWWNASNIDAFRPSATDKG